MWKAQSADLIQKHIKQRRRQENHSGDRKAKH